MFASRLGCIKSTNRAGSKLTWIFNEGAKNERRQSLERALSCLCMDCSTRQKFPVPQKSFAVLGGIADSLQQSTPCVHLLWILRQSLES